MLIPEQINLYIAEHPAWQRKTLVRLRQLIHSTCGNVQENWRGAAPCFEQDGKALVSLGSSKTSVSLCFANGSQLKPGKLEFEPAAEGKNTRTLKFREGDPLPETALVDLLKRCLACNARSEPAKKKDAGQLDLEAVLRKDPTAWANWEGFPAMARREYSDWVLDAKTEEVRKHRIAKAFELIREGMVREEAARKLRDA